MQLGRAAKSRLYEKKQILMAKVTSHTSNVERTMVKPSSRYYAVRDAAKSQDAQQVAVHRVVDLAQHAGDDSAFCRYRDITPAKHGQTSDGSTIAARNDATPISEKP